MAVDVDIPTIEDSAILASALMSSLREYVRLGHLDPHSFRIVRGLPRMVRTMGAVLAWTKLRHSDAVKITRAECFRTSPFEVSIRKTGIVREIEPIRPDGNPDLFDRVPESARVDICTYGQLNTRIKQVRRRERIEIPGISKSGTHCFRHLHASWLYHKGHPVEDIRDFFGHTENSVTQQYIHESIEWEPVSA